MDRISAQGSEAARATAEAVTEAVRALAQAAHETTKHNKVAAEGQALEEHGDEGGKQEVLGTVESGGGPRS